MASFQHEDWLPLYDEKDDKKKTRLIGIEFECKPLEKSKVPEKYQFITEEYLDENEIGIVEEYDDYAEEEYEDVHYGSRVEYIQNQLNELGLEVAGVGYDGGGKEFVTYPDSITLFKQGGSNRLKAIVEMLKESSEPDSASGTHIHVSSLSSDVKTTWNNLYWFTMVFGPQLQKIFGRMTHWARIPLPKFHFYGNDDSRKKIFQAPQKQPQQTSVYAKGSMIVDRENRYEFRGPKATNNIDEVLAWAELCNNIVEVCSRGYIQSVPFSDVLQGEYIRAYVNKIGKECPERKITPAERAMRISEVGYVEVIEKDKLFK